MANSMFWCLVRGYTQSGSPSIGSWACVRSLSARVTDTLIQVEGISGATELGDGKVVLILDAAGLTRSARRLDRDRQSRNAANPHGIDRPAAGARKGA